uniref:Homeobox domain-containing protein n=1 Tax=Steinernema glaseri TaxID=37863 RepID=A0A1I7Y0H2_9BILA
MISEEVSHATIDKKKRRVRTSFARWQLEILEREFLCQQYIVGQQRIELAARLDLNELQVLSYLILKNSATYLVLSECRTVKYQCSGG